MTFYGQEGAKEAEAAQPRPLRNFAYRLFNEGIEHEISAQDIYFYDAGRVGFWNDDQEHPGERILVLATKAFQVREVTTK